MGNRDLVRLGAKTNAIEVYATQLDKTHQQVADLVGVNTTTVKRWCKDPNFVEAVYDRYMVEFGLSLPRVLGAMVREAVQGNVAAGRLVLEHSGKLVKNVNVTIDSPFEKFMKKIENVEDAEIVEEVEDMAVEMELPVRKVENARSRTRQENTRVAEVFKTAEERALVDKDDYNRRQREWYRWRQRAKAVGVPMMSAKKPTLTQRQEWQDEIVRREGEND